MDTNEHTFVSTVELLASCPARALARLPRHPTTATMASRTMTQLRTTATIRVVALSSSPLLEFAAGTVALVRWVVVLVDAWKCKRAVPSGH